MMNMKKVLKRKENDYLILFLPQNLRFLFKILKVFFIYIYNILKNG